MPLTTLEILRLTLASLENIEISVSAPSHPISDDTS